MKSYIYTHKKLYDIKKINLKFLEFVFKFVFTNNRQSQGMNTLFKKMSQDSFKVA